MTAAATSRLVTGACLPRPANLAGRTAQLRPRRGCAADAPACGRAAAPAPEARRLASGLQDFLSDGMPPPPAALTVTRGFSAGNGFATGQLVDRSA